MAGLSAPEGAPLAAAAPRPDAAHQHPSFVLQALEQAHASGLCHGDIKSENAMITSWGWLLLTDFALVKPVYLPDDNPSGATAPTHCPLSPSRAHPARRLLLLLRALAAALLRGA